MEQHPDSSFSPSDLDSASYRERLQRKLNCLIAVLEVANTKVRRSLAAPQADVARLTRIKKNLQDTLDVCLRARAALEKRGTLPPELSKDLAKAVDPRLVDGATARVPKAARTVRARRAWASSAERERLRKFGPIRADMVHDVDLELLGWRLQAGI